MIEVEIIVISEDILPSLIKHLSLPEIPSRIYVLYRKILLLSPSKILKMVWSDGYIYPHDREER